MLFQPILWIVILIALAFGVFSLTRGRGLGNLSGPPPERKQPSALDQLDERYARGEIDREEYLQRKQDIGGR